MSRRTFPLKLRRVRSAPDSRLGSSARAVLLVGLLGLVAACGGGDSGGRESDGTGEAGRGEAGRGEALRTAAEADTAASTPAEVPPGGMEDWVDEMRQRLEVIELDPRASYSNVLRLYNSHHRAMERYYGAGGELTGDDHPELAAAIQRQDSAFHELLELTGTTHYIERTHLLHAIRNVRLAMEEALNRARAAGVPLESTESTGSTD